MVRQMVKERYSYYESCLARSSQTLSMLFVVLAQRRGYDVSF